MLWIWAFYVLSITVTHANILFRCDSIICIYKHICIYREKEKYRYRNIHKTEGRQMQESKGMNWGKGVRLSWVLYMQLVLRYREMKLALWLSLIDLLIGWLILVLYMQLLLRWWEMHGGELSDWQSEIRLIDRVIELSFVHANEKKCILINSLIERVEIDWFELTGWLIYWLKWVLYMQLVLKWSDIYYLSLIDWLMDVECILFTMHYDDVRLIDWWIVFFAVCSSQLRAAAPLRV